MDVRRHATKWSVFLYHQVQSSLCLRRTPATCETDLETHLSRAFYPFLHVFLVEEEAEGVVSVEFATFWSSGNTKVGPDPV